MNNRKYWKIWMRAAMVSAVVSTLFGCGSVTPRAMTGGGGEAGEIVVSTGGEGGQKPEATGGSGSVGGSGATVASTGGQVGTGGDAGAPVATGGAGGVATGGAGGGATGGVGGSTTGGAAGATIVTIDAGTGDAPACPRTLRTTNFGPAVTPTTVGGTSTGVTQTSGVSSGGGPSGSDWVDVLKTNLSGLTDPSNPLASSTGTITFPITQDCNNTLVDTDVGLQGYALSFWLLIQGLPCDNNGVPIQWRVGVVSDAGTTFPWGPVAGHLAMTSCSGSGVSVQGTAFPAGTKAHALVLQFMNISPQAFMGLIDVSDIQLSFAP